MKLICVEEHTNDPAIMRAARPVMERDAPYTALQSSRHAAVSPNAGRRPTMVPMADALPLAGDLGEGRLRHMDEHGIDMQIVSYSSPTQLVPADEGVALARAANDRLAAAVVANPDRLRGFATLPWQAPRAAADELDRAVTELGLNGVLLLGRPGDTFLDDPTYAPVLRKLTDLAVPIYLHPFYPVPQVQQAYYAGLRDEVSAQFSLAAWGWHHEAGIHVLRMILAGIFERFPTLQVISGHWGEMVPFYLSRLDLAMPPAVTGLSKTITETYRGNVWVTPSGMFDEAQFAFIRDTIGVDRLIWSVDYPYLTMDGTRDFLDGLPIDDDDKHKITHRNAENLFRL